MALFQQSSTSLTSAKQIVADSAGASADSTMQTRAGRAIDQAFQMWNNYRLWDFCLVDSDIEIIAPFTATGTVLVDGSASVTGADGTSFEDVVARDLISGDGLVSNTRVTSVDTGADPNTLVVSRKATAGGTVTVTFTRWEYDLPSDFKAMLSARLAGNERTLRYVDQRMYDRFDPIVEASTPTHYTLFPQWLESAGNIRLLPPPDAEETLQLRYYRRLNSTVSPLDIPEDYEYGLISLAKYFFLLDKGGPRERLLGWQQEGMRALRDATARETQDADKTAVFVPGTFHDSGWSPNDTRPYLNFDY